MIPSFVKTSNETTNETSKNSIKRIPHPKSKVLGPTGKKLLLHYQLEEVVGYGSWGKVKRAIDTQNNNRQVAIKILGKRRISRKIKDGINKIYREFDLLKNINHEGIVKYYDLIETDYSHEQSNTASKSHHSASPTKSPTSTSSSLASYSSAGMQDGKIYLIMEWLGDGCNLTSWIQQHQHDNNAESRHIREILKGLLEAIEYLHMAGITHHDIKLDNIIYDPVKRSVKLIDFGVSEQSTNDEAYSAFGTPAYQPPELFTREADGKAVSCSVEAKSSELQSQDSS